MTSKDPSETHYFTYRNVNWTHANLGPGGISMCGTGDFECAICGKPKEDPVHFQPPPK